nr:hypothetical protein CFP56_25421 [Quercus suber]
MVCTNRSANLSKLSRIKLLSIWTNPNHGRTDEEVVLEAALGFPQLWHHMSYLPFCVSLVFYGEMAR